MIRYALAFLGLSAGAGAAQELVPTASVLETCGLHAEVQAEDANDVLNDDSCEAVADEIASDGRSAPEVPPVALSDVIVPARAVVQRGFVPADTPVAKTPVVLVRSMAIDQPACVAVRLQNGLHPFETGAVFASTVDGSNPSAMFCP